MKLKVLIFIFSILSLVAFSQEKLYEYREEIQSTEAKVKHAGEIVQQEFGTPSSPNIWISNSSDYGLMIRAKGDIFYIKVWQISANSDIKVRIEKLMSKIKPVL